MSRRFNYWHSIMLCAGIGLMISACAKDDVAPVDVEKQAFEDLRTEIRETIREQKNC